MEENKLLEEVVEEVETVEEIEESKSKKVLNKIGTGWSKYGKKIVTAVALGAVGCIGYALGKKSGDDYDYETIDNDDIGDSTNETEQ